MGTNQELEELKKEAYRLVKELSVTSQKIAREPLDKTETTNLALIHIMLTLDEILLVLTSKL